MAEGFSSGLAHTTIMCIYRVVPQCGKPAAQALRCPECQQEIAMNTGDLDARK